MTMKAMKLNYDYTAEEVELSKPVLQQPNDILIRIQHAALDTATESVLSKSIIGTFVHARPKDRLILGWHFAGVVEETPSSSSDDFQVGDLVWGHLAYDPSQTQGSLSEYIVVAADACAKVPDKVPAHVAAAASTEGTTALQALRDCGKLETDQRVLVNGAGGGVGSMAVYMAKKLGAKHVTAICSTKDVERVKKLGADVVIDRKQDKVELEQYHVIFDTPNALPVKQSLQHLYTGGFFVATLPTWSFVWGFLYSLFSKKTVTMISCQSKKEDLELIGSWLSDNLSVPIDSRYPIKNLEQAVARLNERSKNGRIVVDVEGGWK